jgi:heterodisulfide reductase subunit B
MIKVGYFPGCSLHGTAIEYEASLQSICAEFDIELVEIKDWNCCGATAAHSLNHLLSIALPARSLALAESQEFSEILVPCAACYSRLLSAWADITLDSKIRRKVSNIIELPLQGTAKPISILEFISRYILPNLKEKIKFPITQKVACYYGCLLVRPPNLVHYDRYEDPMIMEEFVKVLGGKPIEWGFKTECCGAGLSVTRTDLVGKLSGKIVEDAVSRGAEALIAACPMCQSNLDMRRKSINNYLGEKVDIPVMYITQAIGLAMGIEPRKLGTKKHFVSMDKFIGNFRSGQVEHSIAGEV